MTQDLYLFLVFHGVVCYLSICNRSHTKERKGAFGCELVVELSSENVIEKARGEECLIRFAGVIVWHRWERVICEVAIEYCHNYFV